MKKIVYTSLFLLTPLVASAQDLGNLEDLIEAIGDLVAIATPIVVGIALLAFFWGLAKYIFSAGSDEKKAEGKNIMIWGILALFVMVAVFGIVDFLGDAIGIELGGTVDIPYVL